MSTQTPPPGWYPAPDEPGQQRWWDGMKWAAERRGVADVPPPHAVLPTGPKPWPARTAIIIAVVAAVALFIAGAGVLAFLVVLHGSEGQADSRPTSGIERDLERQIDVKVGHLTGERIVGTRVDCLSEVEWHVGDFFRCDVTVPGQKPGYAEVTMETSDGRYSWFISNRSGGVWDGSSRQ